MPTPNAKATNAIVTGILQALAGCALFILFGIGALISMAWSLFASTTGTLTWALFLAGTVGGFIFLWRGVSNITLASRFRKINGIMGNNTYIQFSVLEEKLNYDRKELIKNLRRQISLGFWPDSYLDVDNGAFMLGYAPPYLATDSSRQDVNELLKTANGFIHDMITINLSITNPALKTQVELLINIAKQIYDFVKNNPEKIRQVRQFSNYYLPTTVNLLKNYQELQRQAIKGDNIQESMQKIAGIMMTIETAFHKQLDDLYRDKSLDISVDIEVLQNMINQQAAIK